MIGDSAKYVFCYNCRLLHKVLLLYMYVQQPGQDFLSTMIDTGYLKTKTRDHIR